MRIPKNHSTNPKAYSSAPRQIRGTLDLMENANGDDWRDELYRKVRSLKEMCLPHLNELDKTTEDKLQHQESLLPQKRSDDEFEKLKRLKRTLERMISFLSLPKSKIMPNLKDNIADCEKQIMDLLMMHGLRQLPQSQTIHGMQQNTSSSKPGTRLELGQGSGQNNGNGDDWKEQAYQKLQSLKAMHSAELHEIYQRFAMKVQQHPDSSIPQQQRSVELEKMIRLKTLVERIMQYLSVPKTQIMPNLKDKTDVLENWILAFLNKHRVRNTVQLPQSQTIQDQTNPRMSMQNNVVVSSLRRVSAPQQNIPSFLLASSSLESGQGQQVLAMGSMQQNTSQPVNHGSAQNGLRTLQSNVNQTFLIQLHERQQDKQLMQLQQKFQHRQMQQQELVQLLQQQQQMPQQMIQQIKQQFEYRQMQQLELLQEVNKLQKHLLARQQDQQMRQQLQQHHQMQQQQLQLRMQQQQQMQQQRQQHQMQQQTQQLRQQQQMLQQMQQQRQQHQMQQQPQMLPASNLEPGQGSGLNNANGRDLQEEIIQKFNYMKETYLADVKELYDRVVKTVQQQDPLPPQERSEHYEKQKEFKRVLEHLIRYLSGSKRYISPESKDQMDYIESQIKLYLNPPCHRPARQGQLPQT